MSTRVLIVEDDAALREFLEEALGRRGYAVQTAPGADEALARLRDTDLDVVLTDLNMKGLSGLELCERIAGNRPDIPVVVLTAFGSLETAVRAIRAGAYDFLTKPIDVEPLVIALNRAAQHKALRDEVRRLTEQVPPPGAPATLLGESEPMRRLRAIVERVARSDASVLVTGESGSGKELVARALHDLGPRRDGPFVAVNCAAIPETLIEAELFGHERGAFTDARQARPGLFVQANRGTLFLDEIGELPLHVQPKILRALQERSVRPVGGTQDVPFDARVVAATNRDLEELVEEGRFREDLYYRLNVIHLPVPPLRERGMDVLVLAQRFLTDAGSRQGRRMAPLTPEVARKLLSWSWPGNVRELQNCMERAVALAAFDHLSVDDLPDRIRQYRPREVLPTGDDVTSLVPLAEVERRYIQRVISATRGNRSSAARILGLDRKTLNRKLAAMAVPAPAEDEGDAR